MDRQIPPIPMEVISEILSHLGKKDLLQCRLVNQSWNELSLKILRNPEYEHKHHLVLTQVNIHKFIEFSKERQGEWIVPFHLHFIDGGYDGDDDDEFVDYYEVPNYIKQLKTLFGEKCVSSLTFNNYGSYAAWTSEPIVLPAVQELISILALIAPSLTHLNLSDFNLRYKRNEYDSAMYVKDRLAKTQLEFPNLSKLVSCPPPTYLDEQLDEQNDDNELHSFLIGKSKNLKELEVMCMSDLSVIQTQIEFLRKLNIVEVLKLENPGTFIFPTLPVLKDLTLTYSTRQLDHLILHEFLSSFSTSLQSLTIEFREVPTNPFPRLIQLKYLTIQVSTPIGAIIQVDLGKLNLNSEAFPVLHSMDISTNVYFESTVANPGYSEDEWILETVKSLSITVVDSPFSIQGKDQIDDEGAEIISKASATDYVVQLQKLFPNVTSVTLVDRNYGREAYLNELLIALIQSDGAPRIQELEIQDCAENYLGHILNGLDPDCQPRIVIENMRMDDEFLKSIKKTFQGFSGRSELNVDNRMEYIDGVESRVITCKAPSPIQFKMTGLEKIKIHKSHLGIAVAQKWNQKDLFLMSLPKYLPLLRQIDISQLMFGQDQEFCKQQIIRVQERFSDLIINITK